MEDKYISSGLSILKPSLGGFPDANSAATRVSPHEVFSSFLLLLLLLKIQSRSSGFPYFNNV